MNDWNFDMTQAPDEQPCWIYVPEFDMVHDEVTVAERVNSEWHFGGFTVRDGQIDRADGRIGDPVEADEPDYDDDPDVWEAWDDARPVMIGPQAWMPITKPSAPTMPKAEAST